MPDAIPDRLRMTDHIADAMHDHCPSWSVDTLNAHPLEAIKVYADACARASRLSNSQVRALGKWLAACPIMLGGDATRALNPIHEAARTALASRKRGDLRMDRY